MEPSFFYTNATQAGFSQWDVTMVFQRLGLPSGTKMDGQVTPQELGRVDVAMTPAHAKLFAAIVFRTVMEYEKTIGALEIPPEQRKLYAESIAAIKAGLGA